MKMSKRRAKSLRFARDRRRAKYSPWVEQVESRLLLAVFTVAQSTDDGSGTTQGSLSWAIDRVNSDPNPQSDTIDFGFGGTAPFTISLTGALPPLTHPAYIDGQSQPGYSGAPLIQIQGSGNTSGWDGLTLASGSGGSAVTGLCISGFGSGAGIYIESNGNLIQGDYLGTDATGSTAQTNEFGILVDNGSQNTIGGTDDTSPSTGNPILSNGNLISGNTKSGVWLTDGSSKNVLEGNFIGTGISGTVSLSNGSGVLIDSGAGANTIGGSNEIGRGQRISTLVGNVISGNSGDGVTIADQGTSGNVVEGNSIGVGATGVVALGNGNGVTIKSGATSNVIGGSSPETRNIISGNAQSGVAIDGANTSKNAVAGNYIGTGYSGIFALSNSTGVLISNGAQSNTIGAQAVGGILPGNFSNLISGNKGSGVDIEGGSMKNTVEGNFIGTDPTGTQSVANAIGVQIGTAANQNTIGVGQDVGSADAEEGNVISGNLNEGVLIAGTGRGPLDFQNGFGKIAGQLALNSSTTSPSGQLILTDGGYYESASAFSTSVLGVAQFATNFSFQIKPGTDPTADGFTFTIQGVGPTALGYSGGGLGYGSDSPQGALGIGKSVAIKFDLYNNQGEGDDSTGLYTDGASPTFPALDLSSSGIDLHSTDIFDVSLNYDGATLTETITDTHTGATFSHPYTVNIPAIVGGPYAYVGFTAGTGGLTAVQAIDTWTFTPLPTGKTSDNVVAGDLIGTDSSGMNPLGNGTGANGTGVLITGGAVNNTVGGSFAGSVNLISGNLASGVDLEGVGTSGNVVEGDHIGTDLSGTVALPNPTGVLIGGSASQNIIGAVNVVNPDRSIQVLRGNIISGNENNGVHIQGSGNMVEGNLIGPNINLLHPTDVEANKFLSDSVGVLLDNGAVDNTIDMGNVIACNITAGVEISGTQPPSLQTSQNVVAGNFIGTDPTGLLFLGNQIGVLIDNGATSNIVGGSRAVGNVISSNLGPGVDIRGTNAVQTSGNTVAGNFIGTDSTGEHVANPTSNNGLYNPIGVLLEADATSNTIGGLNELSQNGTPFLSQGNLISGNPVAGVEITGSGSNEQTAGNVIEGNFIGTDIFGETTFDRTIQGYSLGNGAGVLIVGGQGGAVGNTVGGTAAGARNLISGNLKSGVEINGGGGYAGAFQNVVEGNYIGTDITGTKQGLENVIGVLIDAGAYDNTVGGPNETDSQGKLELSSGNLISGNTTGVDISGAGGYPPPDNVSYPGNVVQGNFIGTDSFGTSAVPNSVAGVTIEGASSWNTIGALTPSARNVISGNTGAGVVINGSGATSNLLEGNYIGTDVDGGSADANGIGVLIVAGASGNTVGGITDAAQDSRNVISGNTGAGVEILGFQSSSAQGAASGNCIEGNYIGTDSTGTIARGNNVGVLLSNAPNNMIGSTNVEALNVISGNGSVGVEILGLGSTNECLMGNFIGPDASGDNALPGSAISDPTKAVQQTGILIDGSMGNYVGESGAPVNVISGNMVGIEFTGIGATSSGPTNTVTCNYIGIGNDQHALGNVIGVFVNAVPQTQIGCAGAGNFIAGNTQAGVYIIGSDATRNLVQGNMIGLGPDGQTYNQRNGKNPTKPFPIGVYIQDSSSNTIGGTAKGAGNWISGNNVGVYIFGSGGSSTDNQVMGNSIGLSFDSGSRPGNLLYGVMLYNAPDNNAPLTGRSRNQFAKNGIANFREFSGKVPPTQASSTGKGSGSKAKKPAHNSHHVAQQSSRRTASHAAVTVHGRHVPAGPMRKPRARVRE